MHRWFNSVLHVPDVNECSRDPPPCKEDQYCLNTDGSYSCKGRILLSVVLCLSLRREELIKLTIVFSLSACDEVCSGCTGPGADQCQSCAGGYHESEGTCKGTSENKYYLLEQKAESRHNLDHKWHQKVSADTQIECTLKLMKLLLRARKCGFINFYCYVLSVVGCPL